MLKKLLRFVLISFGVLALGFILLVFFAVRAEKNEQILAEESGFESVSQMEIAQSAGFDTGEGFKQHLAELQAQQEAEAERLALEEEAVKLSEVEAAAQAARKAEEAAAQLKQAEQLNAEIIDEMLSSSYFGFLQPTVSYDYETLVGGTCSEVIHTLSSTPSASGDVQVLGTFFGVDRRRVTWVNIIGQAKYDCDAHFGFPCDLDINVPAKGEISVSSETGLVVLIQRDSGTSQVFDYSDVGSGFVTTRTLGASEEQSLLVCVEPS